MSPPTVTVVIPYYEAAAWIEETLRSVFVQDRPPLEILLVDDGSPDHAALEAVLERLATHPRFALLRLIRQPNAGPSAARNRGVREARGECVAFLDADDRWAPSLLAEACEALAGASAPDLVFFDGWTAGPSGEAPWRTRSRSPSEPAPGLADLLGGTSTVITSGVVVRRHLLLEVGGFDEAMWRSEDFDLWLRLLRRGARFRALPAPLVHRRLLGTGLSRQDEQMRIAIRTVLSRHLADPSLPRSAARAARRFDRAIRIEEAVAAVRSAILARPAGETRRLALGRLRRVPSLRLLRIVIAVLFVPGLARRRAAPKDI